jgi:acyl-coenzyme A thioesterase 13
MMPEMPDETRAMTGFPLLCGMRTLGAGAGQAKVELSVRPDVENPNGALHGGAIATLVDQAGTLAIMSADRQGRPGVTTDLNVTFLLPAPSGSAVIAEATVLKIGRTMAYVTVDVRRSTDGALVAQGRMTKFQAV